MVKRKVFQKQIGRTIGLLLYRKKVGAHHTTPPPPTAFSSDILLFILTTFSDPNLTCGHPLSCDTKNETRNEVLKPTISAI